MTTVLITGLGLLAPNGIETDAYWKALLDGNCGIRPLENLDVAGFPSSLAGQIDDFDAGAHLPGRLLPGTDRSTQLALVAAQRGLAEAGLPNTTTQDYDIGVVTSNALGGFAFTHKEFHALWNEGPRSVSVYESYAWFYAVNTGQVSIRHALRGPGTALVGEQAGGLDALGQARRSIRHGTRAVVAGGVDSALDPWGYASQLAGGFVSTVKDPSLAYQPFGTDASGFVPGEGGAFLVLEDAECAVEREAKLHHGVLAGYASTFDPAPGTGRQSNLGRAMAAALQDAGLVAKDIDAVFADGAGTAELDAAEAEALCAVFGAHGVPVTVPKAHYGRLYAGGGPLDVATALLSMRHGTVPATPTRSEVPAKYGLDLVREAREQRVRHAMVIARGRHGFNSAVVVSGL
ncbi:ketosynthase chain-length factor [Streptomyces chumphonensis]|uniref:Ketosynthase chain-length factor n=1 Tax=Streptomyces chumphonensis TaxID=1214925 RepID=A0A927EYD2_9ACTN|nr:beta-ketoacyl synthase N-terminal-like domain-containing protein [Streptomyces chumphonensis]MBD3931011.1 ketosynthase chain-length factor [Streptomyces chumphonensis]